jgi:predicted phage terminase large subunit-like protein
MLDGQMVEGFVGSLLQRKFDHATTTPKCHKDWWELCCSDSQYVAIAAPRNHAKSTAVTFSWLLASVLFREHQFVILVSDTETQATLFLGDIKQELIENEDLVSLFGIKKFSKLSETDIIVEMSDGYKFRIIAKGSEQKLRGLKWANKRPDLILCDDLENDEITNNADRREKFRRWFYGALLPSKSNEGKVIIVGTILHMDSMLERLMPPTGSPYTEYDGLLTYSTKPSSMWKAVKYKAHNEDFSKRLWPERYSKERLQEIKQGYLDQGMPDMYSQEYLNYPIDESSAYFRRDDFLPITTIDQEQHLVYYAAVDFAVSTRERSDFTVIAIVGVDAKGILQVKDIRRGRWDAQQIVEEMFLVHKRYDPKLFVVEQGVIHRSIRPFLDKEQLNRNTYINLYPMVPTKDKLTRARSLQARLRAGGIRFDKEATWYPTLEDEMVRFPKDRHDDQVDALSWIGLALDVIQEAPTAEELQEEEWEDSHDVSNEYSGMSLICGY